MPKLSPISGAKLITAFKKTTDFQSGDELNSDMSSSFRGNPAFKGGEDVIRILSKEGFIGVRHKGSHVRVEHSDCRKTSVPMHSGENVGVGLLRKILRDVNITPEDFNKLK